MINSIQSSISAFSTAHNVYYCQTISGIRRGSEPQAGSRSQGLCSVTPPKRPGAAMLPFPGRILSVHKPRRSAHIQAGIPHTPQPEGLGLNPSRAAFCDAGKLKRRLFLAASQGSNPIQGGVLPCKGRKVHWSITCQPDIESDSQITLEVPESIQPIFFNHNIKSDLITFERRGGVSMCQPASMPPRLAHPMDYKSRDECMGRAGKCDGSEKGCWKW